MSAILTSDFQKRKQLRFSEVNYLNYTKRPNFARGSYIFPKTRGNKNKPWTHSTPRKLFNATVANADIKSLKSLHTLFDKYLDHMLVKAF